MQLDVLAATTAYHALNLFQFHIGAIRCIALVAIIYAISSFNSILVQLDEDGGTRFDCAVCCFNSILVQLDG